MNKKIKTEIVCAIIGALITTCGSVLVFFLGDFSTQKSLEKSTVETLSNYFDSIDTNMEYKEALQNIYEEYQNVKNENTDLKNQLNLMQEENRNHSSNNVSENNSNEKKSNAVKSQYFLDNCKPYETSYHYKEYINGEVFKMSGQDKTNGFTIMGYGNYVLSNTNAEYSELSFEVGHVDGSAMNDAKLSIYLDGEFYNAYDIKAEALPIDIVVPLNNIKQVKLLVDDGCTTAMYSTTIGFSNMIIKN